MSSVRLLDYFAVFGLDETQPISIITGNQCENDNSTLLTNSIHYIENTLISGLRLRVTSKYDNIISNNPFVQYLEIAVNDSDKLWLEVVYGRLNGQQLPGWNGKAICNIALLYMPFEGRYLKIPESRPVEPVPLVSEGACHSYASTTNGVRLYIGEYDVTAFLQAERKTTHNLIFTYDYTEKPDELPITEMKIIQAQYVDHYGEKKKLAYIPENYDYINYPLGADRDAFLAFRRQKNPLNLVYKPEFIEKFPRVDHPDNGLSQAIEMFCFPEGIKLSNMDQLPITFSFILTTIEETGDRVPRVPRLYVVCLVFYEHITDTVSEQLNIPQSISKTIFMPKAICLVSHWPFITQLSTILQEIYRLHLSNLEIPLERIICNLMTEIPLPDLGSTAVQYDIGSQRIKFTRPPPKHLPYLPDESLEYLFRTLSIEDIVTVWSCIMIERKILLISSKKSLLTHSAMAFIALIFPFNWHQVLIPVLPVQLRHYIEAIIPYIIGVTPNVLKNDVEIPAETVKVDLDRHIIEMQQSPPRLPDNARRHLISRLNNISNVFNPKDNSLDLIDQPFSCIEQSEPNRKFNMWAIRDAFLEFQTNLMKNYQRYYTVPEAHNSTELRECFNVPGFLAYLKSNKPTSFLYKITETSLFSNFIESRYYSVDSHYEINYFDEAMKFKRTRSEPLYVKPYEVGKLYSALSANDIGIEPGSRFTYDRFPRLNDNYFIEPRKVKQLAVTWVPKATLVLKDDLLKRMQATEWANFLLYTIYRIWFIAYTASMPKYIEQASELLDLGLMILESMKKKGIKPDEEIYRRLIEACGHCGLKGRVLNLFKLMKNHGFEPDACTHGVYVKAVAEGQKYRRILENMKNNEPSSASLSRSLDLESCVFVTANECPSCETLLNVSEIIEGWERSYVVFTTTCPLDYCGAKFVPRFKVLMDRGLGHEEGENVIEVEFLSPLMLRKEIESLIYSEGEAFLADRETCEKHKVIFWNMVLYFEMLQLPKFFLNPSYDTSILPYTIGVHLSRQFPAQVVNESIMGPRLSTSYDEEGEHSPKELTSKDSIDYQSTRSTRLNDTVFKIFAPNLKEFEMNNKKRGVRHSLLEQMAIPEEREVSPKLPHVMPVMENKLTNENRE
jgi:pentatricopeptide repeat protein